MSTATRKSGWSCSRTKPTTIPPRSSLSAARPPAWAAPSATRLSGRAYVYQAMRVTGSGDPRQPVAATLPGKLPQRKITTEAAHGFSSYGNQVGLATGQVSEIYHPGYVAKRMEIGAVIGAAPRNNVMRRVPAAGDVVLLVGGRTGRDGIGGATGSSKAHSEAVPADLRGRSAERQSAHRKETAAAVPRSARQPADQALQRFRRRRRGRGGRRAGRRAWTSTWTGCPKNMPGSTARELALSESQERMAVVVAAAQARRFQELAAAENLEATVIARVERPAAAADELARPDHRRSRPRLSLTATAPASAVHGRNRRSRPPAMIFLRLCRRLWPENSLTCGRPGRPCWPT